MLYVKKKLEININYADYLKNLIDCRPARPAQQSPAVAAAMLPQRRTAPTPRSTDGFGWEIWTRASPSKL